MTIAADIPKIHKLIANALPGARLTLNEGYLLIDAADVAAVMGILKSDPAADFDYLDDLTAVDYYKYLEVVYRLTSLRHNHTLVLKTRCTNTTNPVLASVTSIWKGADYPEREVFDLFGIRFNGHPNLSRIVLWEGFQGHPLRKEYML